MDIAEFLTARLDEDEHAARMASDANPPPWYVAGDGGHVRGRVVHRRNDYIDGGLWDNESTETLEMVPVTAEHIARHDPARVLAEVAAKRAILAWAVAHPRTCGSEHPQFDVHHPDGHGPHEVALMLAQPYATHPEFDPAWRVTEPAAQ